ncbi:MAG: tetratricopeptide repeat protein [Acidobacteria bacterium]|nr:tetratricopeptide repeat protein [Acidobacteriota bacterium]
MKPIRRITVAALWAVLAAAGAHPSTPPEEGTAGLVSLHFKAGNALMEKKEYARALEAYEKALTLAPEHVLSLFNGGLAAFLAGKPERAAELWERCRSLEPDDWQVRAKLVQAWQARGMKDRRDREREGLLALRASGRNADLNQKEYFCRDQFSVGDYRVFGFEHFELKGDRALRYVFMIVRGKDAFEFRISLGSYDSTNAFWTKSEEGEAAKKKYGEGVRLFHLDGYFPNGHATYGFYVPEPSYDEVREKVVAILEEKDRPISSSTFGAPAPKPGEKPKP